MRWFRREPEQPVLSESAIRDLVVAGDHVASLLWRCKSKSEAHPTDDSINAVVHSYQNNMGECRRLIRNAGYDLPPRVW